jgi:glycerophosphoryl diester phosphodiesterase
MIRSTFLKPGHFAAIAHRGGSLEAPENTLAAFENATSIYPGIYFELDVHPTRDGEIVVHHDKTIDRTTNGHGQIEGYTYDELIKFDAGHHFSNDDGKTFPFRDKGIKIPLLKDVLKNFPNTHISIELKSGHGFFGDKVIKILRQAEAESRVVLASFDHGLLLKTALLAPHICSGYSRRELLFNSIWTRFGIPFLGPHRGHVMQPPYIHEGRVIADKKFIDRAHRNKKFIHVWTVNDEPTIRQLIKDGVDGIISDAPSLLVKVARDLKKI